MANAMMHASLSLSAIDDIRMRLNGASCLAEERIHLEM
jgi:hypothetical protein